MGMARMTSPTCGHGRHLVTEGCEPCNRLPRKEAVNHPDHYNTVPGIECIDVIEHFNLNRGNAMKYIWRAGLKGDEVEDLQKAKWYIEREIARVQAERTDDVDQH